jgi:hypothetical protein
MPAADIPLMDHFHAWTFQKKVDGRPLSPAVLNQQTRMRMLLRKAQRFNLDDDAVRLICHLSHQRDRFPAWSFLARLPYDTMWVEFDLHTKIKEFEAMGSLGGARRAQFEPERVAPRLGLLLHRDDPESDSPRWVCHEFYLGNKMTETEHYFGWMTYVFDPEGDTMFPIRGSKFWRQPTLSLLPDFPKDQIGVHLGDADAPAVWVDVDVEHLLCGMFETKKDEDGLSYVAAPDWFVNRSAVIYNPWWQHYIEDRDRERRYRVMIHEARELSGAFRWVITMLATINGLPRDVKPVHQRTGGRTVGMNVLPYFQHNNLSLTIPRDDRVVYARQALDRLARNSRRPQHDVIGHWRVIERGKAKGLCRHMPVMVEHGVGLCERCELLIRWISNHTRGDPTLGIITHDVYNIHGKKRLTKRTDNDGPGTGHHDGTENVSDDSGAHPVDQLGVQRDRQAALADQDADRHAAARDVQRLADPATQPDGDAPGPHSIPQ